MAETALTEQPRRAGRIKRAARFLWTLLPERQRRIWIRYGWLAFLLIGISVALIDLPLAKAMAKKSETIHSFFAGITDIGKSTFWLVSIALAVPVLWYLGDSAPARGVRRVYRWAINYLIFAFAAIAISGLTVNLVKLLIGRARPRMWFREEIFGFQPPGLNSDFQSFPSGHASTMMAVSAALALFLPRWRTPILCTGLFMAMTRVIVNAHYLGDVIAASFLTIFVTPLIAWYCAARGWVFEAGPGQTIRCRTEGRFLAGKLRRKLTSRR